VTDEPLDPERWRAPHREVRAERVVQAVKPSCAAEARSLLALAIHFWRILAVTCFKARLAP
jgi:hypothetical protein